MRINRPVLMVSLILVSAMLAAAAQPNLTGEWKLNVSKSEFGQMPSPNSMTQKISHEDPNLTVAVKSSSERGDFEWESKYTTDGKECTNTMRDNPMKSVVKWDGETLTFETKGKFGDNEFTMTDKWAVSGEGKILTINRHVSSSFGEGDQKLVFEKQ